MKESSDKFKLAANAPNNIRTIVDRKDLTKNEKIVLCALFYLDLQFPKREYFYIEEIREQAARLSFHPTLKELFADRKEVTIH